MVMTLIRAQRWGLSGVAGLVLALTLAAGPAMAGAGRYVETDLASDIQGRAQNLDASLVNPWGLVRGPSTPGSPADNGVGQSTPLKPHGTRFEAPVNPVNAPMSARTGTRRPTGIAADGSAS